MSVQGTPLSRQEERLVWPWMSFYGRMSPGFATDSVDMDCGIWPILPALGSILGIGAAGGVGFCSLSEPHPAPGRCHLPPRKVGSGICRDLLAQLGGVAGGRGAAMPQGKGVVPDSPGFITAVTWWEQGRGVRPQPAHLFLAATQAGLSFLGCSFPV